MQKLSNVLVAATAAIEPGYFRLTIHGCESASKMGSDANSMMKHCG